MAIEAVIETIQNGHKKWFGVHSENVDEKYITQYIIPHTLSEFGEVHPKHKNLVFNLFARAYQTNNEEIYTHNMSFIPQSAKLSLQGQREFNELAIKDIKAVYDQKGNIFVNQFVNKGDSELYHNSFRQAQEQLGLPDELRREKRHAA